MFNSKKIKELEDRIWQLENPSKHKVGDKVDKDFIITKVDFKRYDDVFTYGYRYYYYEAVNIKTGKIIKSEYL